MANQGKHTKNPVTDYLEGEENTVPTQSRGSHVVDSYIKKSKVTLKKFRPPATGSAPQTTDALMLRDPAPPPKADSKASQSASYDHQRRLERLSQLRAPHHFKNR